MSGWVTQFLEEHCVEPWIIQSKYYCNQHNQVNPFCSKCLNTAIYHYGMRIGRRWEEIHWPIAIPLPCRGPRGHMGIYAGRIPPDAYNDEWIWPACTCCGYHQSYDRLRYVGPCTICYACFDLVRVRVAEIIRATLRRFILRDLLPSDVLYSVYGLLYRLMLDV